LSDYLLLLTGQLYFGFLQVLVHCPEHAPVALLDGVRYFAELRMVGLIGVGLLWFVLVRLSI
jgi:hypothetical protein